MQNTALSFQSGAMPTARTSVTTTVRFHALMPAQFTPTFDALTRFLVVCVDHAAFGIVQYLWAHRDVQDWVECQRNVRDPRDRSWSMAGMPALLPARVCTSGRSGADPVLIDPTRVQ